MSRSSLSTCCVNLFPTVPEEKVPGSKTQEAKAPAVKAEEAPKSSDLPVFFQKVSETNHIKDLAIILEEDRYVTIGMDGVCVYYENKKEGCEFKCGNETTVVKNQRLEEVMGGHLKGLFENPKLTIIKFTILTHDVKEKVRHNMYLKLEEILKGTGRPLAVGLLKMDIDKIINDVMHILPYLNPITLSILNIQNQPTGADDFMKDIVKTPQWKGLKGFNCNYLRVTPPTFLKNFTHLQYARVTLHGEISLGFFKEIKEKFLKNPKLMDFKIAFNPETNEAHFKEISDHLYENQQNWAYFKYPEGNEDDLGVKITENLICFKGFRDDEDGGDWLERKNRMPVTCFIGKFGKF